MGLSRSRIFKFKLGVLLVFTILVYLGFNITAYASIPSNPSWQSSYRCATDSPSGQWTLVAELQNSEVSINTPLGGVVSAVTPIGGQWNFYCNPDYDYPSASVTSGRWLIGFPTTYAPAWSGDPSVCLLPELAGSGMGVRFFNEFGGVVPCGNSAHMPPNRLLTIPNGSITSQSYSGMFAEIVRVGPIPAGTYTLPHFNLYVQGKEKTQLSGNTSVWDLEFVNATFEAAACFMAGHNQTIDFGERARGAEVYTKPFDIWLVGCDGQELIDFKASAKLSFASSRINMFGTELANCNDTDCADGVYITFSDFEGDNVNLHAGYAFNEQANTPDNRLSFNAHLHSENTSAGKIDTSLTLIVEYF